MAMGFAYYKTLPGILKQVAILLTDVTFMLSMYAADSYMNRLIANYLYAKDNCKKYPTSSGVKHQPCITPDSPERSPENKREPAQRTFFGMPIPGSKLKCDYEDLPPQHLQNIAIAIIFFIVLIACIILVLHTLIEITSKLKKWDTIFHAIAGVLLLICGGLLIYHIAHHYDCFKVDCDIEEFKTEKGKEWCEDENKNRNSQINFAYALAAGVIALFVGLLYIAIAVLLFMTRGPGGRSMAEEMGMADNKLSRMINQTPSQAQAQAQAQQNADVTASQQNIEEEATPAQV